MSRFKPRAPETDASESLADFKRSKSEPKAPAKSSMPPRQSRDTPRRRADGPKTERIVALLNDELAADLRAHAARNKMSISHAVECAVRDWLINQLSLL